MSYDEIPTGTGPFEVDDDGAAALGSWDSGYSDYSYDSWDYGSSWSDTSFDDLSWSAWDQSNAWDANAYDYWNMGDYASYDTASAIADDMGWYSSSMEYLSQDPTDYGAWSDAWESAESASWDAWNQSVDAWATGDYETAAYWDSVSDDYGSMADSTWSAWGDYTSTDYSSSYADTSYSSSTSVISDDYGEY